MSKINSRPSASPMNVISLGELRSGICYRRRKGQSFHVKDRPGLVCVLAPPHQHQERRGVQCARESAARNFLVLLEDSGVVKDCLKRSVGSMMPCYRRIDWFAPLMELADMLLQNLPSVRKVLYEAVWHTCLSCYKTKFFVSDLPFHIFVYPCGSTYKLGFRPYISQWTPSWIQLEHGTPRTAEHFTFLL